MTVRPQPGSPLTSREREVLDGVAAGETMAAIGRRLGISTRMAKYHAQCLRTRLGARNLPHAVALDRDAR